VHPANPNIVYVGAAQGGVYRSLDGGATWTPLMDSALSLAIGAITIDPLDPTRVFVGTGEGNLSGDSFFGVGLYRIDNADTTPVLSGPFEIRIPGTGTDAGNGHAFLGTSITKIVVDPANDNRIFVGNTVGVSGLDGTSICCGGTAPPSGSLGLYFSANALSDTPQFSLVAGLPGGGLGAVTDMALEPGSSSSLVVGVEDLNSPDNNPNTGIYRSTDATSAPAASPAFTETLNLEGEVIGFSFAINKVGPAVTVLAATDETDDVCVDSTGNAGLLRQSIDGGATWPNTIPGASGFCGGQCSYDKPVAMDPANASVIYIAGNADSDGGGPSARPFDACQSATFVKSTDGATFNIQDGSVHPNGHAIAIAPSDSSVIYFGNDGGIFKSTDSGSTWSSINTNGFSATQFQSLALHPSDRNFMIGGTQDNGTQLMAADGTWNRVDFSDGGYSLIDQNAPDTASVTMYHTFFNISGDLVGYAGVTSTANATEGNWNFFGCNDGVTPANGITCDDAVLFYAPLVRGPGNPNSVYYGTDRLYRSADGGTTNTVVSQTPIVDGAPVSTIAISPQNDNVRVVGLANGQVFVTTTGSSTLTDITGALPAAYVARAVIDPNNSNIAYVTLDDYGLNAGEHVWKTTNLSSPTPTWSASGSGIPDVPVNSFVVDPNDSGFLYAGTDIGVYHSSDGGATWTPFGAGLPRVAVFDIAIQNSNRVLRVATHGRGIWETAPEAPPTTSTTTTVSSSVNPSVFGQTLTFTATVTPAPTDGELVTFNDGTNPLGIGTIAGGVATLTTSSLAVGSHVISAVYAGDDNLLGSAGNLDTNPQVVSKADTTTVVASSPNASLFGQPVTFTATITDSSAGSTAAPAGTVQFVVDGVNFGAPVDLAAAGSNSSTAASQATASLSVAGSPHTVTANYVNADGNFSNSGSSLIGGQVVNPAVTLTAVESSSNPSVFGQSVTFTASVIDSSLGSTAPPTGAVQFVVDGINFGAPVTLTAESSNISTATSQATASLSVGGSPHTITANYVSADENFSNSSNSLNGGQTVTAADTTTVVTSDTNPSNLGQTVTFKATVSAVPPGSGTPTGNVTFKDGSTTLGTGTLSVGAATFATSSLSTGSHNITAVYGGDAGFTGSTSPILTQVVAQSADISVTLTHGPDPANLGGRLTFTATVHNNGPGTASVNFTETLVGRNTLVSAIPSLGTCSGAGPVHCDLGSMTNGQSITVTIVVTPIRQARTVSATATVTSDVFDSNPANNTASNTARVRFKPFHF
jgi:hypothetical protein